MRTTNRMSDGGRMREGARDCDRDARHRRCYMLLNERGEPVGKIVAAEARPMVGKHAPTFYVRREGDDH